MAIYGRERVGYSLVIVDENNSAIKDTVNWEMEDVFTDSTDNTKTIEGAALDDEVSMVYESKGDKKTIASIEFDDGWGNIYRHEKSITVTTVTYNEPLLDFSWTPLEPIINEEVNFTQNNIDTRDDNNVYGEILSVDYDQHNNGTTEQENLKADEGFSYSYPKREDTIEIREIATYSDGWKNKTVDLVKTLKMDNIPPIAKYNYSQDSHCVPIYNWIAESTDGDGDDTKIAHTWALYLKNSDDDWDEVSSKDGNAFSFPFQFEGDYKLSLTATDEAGAKDIETDTFSMEFIPCGTQEPETDANNTNNGDEPFSPSVLIKPKILGADCMKAIALAIANYKRENPPTKQEKSITIITGNKMSNAPSCAIDGHVNGQDLSGKINTSAHGKINISSASGKIGGSLSGKMKK